MVNKKRKKIQKEKNKKQKKQELKTLTIEPKTIESKTTKPKKRNHHSKKGKKILFPFLIFTGLLVYSIIHIFSWKQDNEKVEKQTETIQEKVEIKESEEKNTEIVNTPSDPKDPYFDYIKVPLMEVDFQELKKINPQTKGWIQVKGTNINYPFVQGKDNEYYLKHTFDKQKNNAGWVYMDYRNKENDKNTILYAHGRQNKTMFGSLANILNSNWYQNKDNYIVRLSTPKENTSWQVFSVYKIPNTSDYLQINFTNDQSYYRFLNKLLNRSAYDFHTIVNERDQILTLSTCYNDDYKVVLHAKLIKKETR